MESDVGAESSSNWRIIQQLKIMLLVRMGISAAVLWIVLRLVDFHRLIGIFENLQYGYIAGALVLTIIIRVIMAVRWSVLLRSQGVFISCARLLQIIMTSHSLGVLIPSSLGADGLKALALSRETGNSANAISSVFVDRISGLLALASIAFPVSLFVFHKEGSLKYLIVSGCAFLLCVLSVIVVAVLEDRIYRFCMDFRKGRDGVLLKKLKNLITSFALIGRDRGCLLIVFGYSIVTQLLRILLVFMCASALNIDIELQYFAIFEPVIMLLMMLPISISGIGLKEAAYFNFFGYLGMTLEEAVGLSFFSYLEDVFWVLLGLGVYWLQNGTGKKSLVKPEVPAG